MAGDLAVNLVCACVRVRMRVCACLSVCVFVSICLSVCAW